jgi:small subunit ribosomal protein S4
VARETGPQCKQCRREGQKLFLKGERCLTDKCGVERRNYPPGDHGRGRSRHSEYRLQLREKQKARRYYGVLEKQFRNYYARASRQEGMTGANLLRMLESRFDNVLVRLGFAGSRRQARQFIRHGHWAINGKRVDIPSYQVRSDDVITLKPGSSAEQVIRDATELTAVVPAWLQADHDGLTAKVLRLPEREEIATPVQEQLIVELYSK